MKRFLILLLLSFMALGLVTTVFAVEPDSAGITTGGAPYVVVASANVPTADDLKTYNF
jgi:hypothetical protein